MRRVFKKSGHPPAGADYWMSYSDLMAAMMLIFILLLVAVMFDNQHKIRMREEQLEREQQLLAQERAANRQNKKKYDALYNDVSKVLGVRTRILARLRERFDDAGGEISFDDATGAVRLGSRILFDEGSASLKREGRVTLDETMPTYFDALLGDPQLREHVAQIVIEGHTNSNFSQSRDARAGYLFNLALSQERAFEAMEHILKSKANQSYDPFSLLAANGYSSSRPIRLPDGEEDKERSRRIEIRFRLKDEQALHDLKRKLGAQDLAESQGTR